jgi:hypothetical protein
MACEFSRRSEKFSILNDELFLSQRGMRLSSDFMLLAGSPGANRRKGCVAMVRQAIEE